MPAHNWTNPIRLDAGIGVLFCDQSAGRCKRCGVERVRNPFKPTHAQNPFRYHLQDGLGDPDSAPPCQKSGESRHSRKAGRRAKALARSRAGSPRPKRKRPHAVLDL